MRKTGYYWVKIKDRWIVAKFMVGKTWYTIGDENFCTTDVFDEIDETPITRTSLAEQHKATRYAAIDVVKNHFDNAIIHNMDELEEAITRDIHNLPQSPITK